MATDAFTNVNGTLLSAHAAGGNTWAPLSAGEVFGEITGNRADCGSGFNVSARASNSTSLYSQIVFKAGAYGAESKTLCVRADAASERFGYCIQCYDPPDVNGVFSTLVLRKDAGFLTGAPVSMDRDVDHTVAIKLTPSGGDIIIEGWLDGVALVWNETLPGFSGPPGTQFTDTAANTPIAAGNPGFFWFFTDDMSQAASGFDDWTDVEPSAVATLSSPTPSGTVGTQTTATIGATTNQNSGTFYVVVDTGSNLVGVTATQIKAGQRASGAAALASNDTAISTTTPSAGVAGLLAGTSYAYAAIQNNANGDSNIVTGTFTTAAAVPASGTSGAARSRVAILMLS